MQICLGTGAWTTVMFSPPARTITLTGLTRLCPVKRAAGNGPLSFCYLSPVKFSANARGGKRRVTTGFSAENYLTGLLIFAVRGATMPTSMHCPSVV
jgi:hypothetical protein